MMLCEEQWLGLCTRGLSRKVDTVPIEATCFNYLILICFDFEANSRRKESFVLLFAAEEWATESYHVVWSEGNMPVGYDDGTWAL